MSIITPGCVFLPVGRVRSMFGGTARWGLAVVLASFQPSHWVDPPMTWAGDGSASSQADNTSNSRTNSSLEIEKSNSG